MTTYHSRLLTPPREEEEIYPYRRVWRSIIIEYTLLFIVVIITFALEAFTRFRILNSLQNIVNVGAAILPLMLWGIFSAWQERRVNEPRQRLIAVCVVSALAANAVGIPLIEDFLKIDKWLPLSSAINRIIGYTFTVGIVQEFLKFLILHYMVWGEPLRVRIDAVAYAAASAVGYATVLNLHFVFDGSLSLATVTATVFAVSGMHLVTTSVVAYSLSELYFDRPTLVLAPMALLAAAFITAVAIPIRAGLVNATWSTPFTVTRPLFGIMFSAFFLLGVLSVIALLFNNAERQAREAAVHEV